MPPRPLTYCARCVGVCSGQCKQERSKEYDRGRANDPFKSLRNTARWRALRLVIKLRDVLCKACGHRAVQEIDHVIPAKVWVAQGVRPTAVIAGGTLASVAAAATVTGFVTLAVADASAGRVYVQDSRAPVQYGCIARRGREPSIRHANGSRNATRHDHRPVSEHS